MRQRSLLLDGRLHTSGPWQRLRDPVRWSVDGRWGRSFPRCFVYRMEGAVELALTAESQVVNNALRFSLDERMITFAAARRSTFTVPVMCVIDGLRCAGRTSCLVPRIRAWRRAARDQ